MGAQKIARKATVAQKSWPSIENMSPGDILGL